MFPEGYISNATEWRAPVWPPHNTNASKPCDPARQCGRAINLTLANTTDGDGFHGIFDNYTLGTGPGCSMYDPPRSPWCGPSHTPAPTLHSTPSAMLRGSASAGHTSMTSS